MKITRQTSGSVRVLVQDIENSKPVTSKSFTVYETSLGEVFKVVSRAIEETADRPDSKRKLRKPKTKQVASRNHSVEAEATPAS